VVRRSNKLDKVTYSDCWFYSEVIDIKYYFLERFGLKPKEVEDHVPTNEDGGVNSSRILKAQTEATNTGNNDLLVLADNVKKEIKRDIDLPNKGYIVNTGSGLKSSQMNTNEIGVSVSFITYCDYLKLPKGGYYNYDLRSINRYIRDELIQHHSVIKLIFKDSLIDPRYLSFLKLVFRINLILTFNALTYTDNLIETNSTYMVIYLLKIG
jgi:hypothetical protein